MKGRTKMGEEKAGGAARGKAQHTPGPWVEGLDASGIVVVERRTAEVIAELGPFGAAAELVETRLANAKLIAAAPLLADRLEFDSALLKRIARFLDTCADCDDLLDDVNGAIGHNAVALRTAGRCP